MATKARQQYFADEVSLSKEKREFSIADEIQQKIDSIEEGAQVNKIETVKVNGTALVPDANKAVNIDVPEVIDNLYTVDSDNALSAKQGKLLYDYIQNIASRGRFLSNWNSATGLPMTNPSESPYPYKSGDYFVVSNVAGLGGTNYRPDGSSYIIGQASTVVETNSVDVSDFYFYDGTNWLLLKNSGRSLAVDSSLSTTSINPVENRVITNALNGKANDTDVVHIAGDEIITGGKTFQNVTKIQNGQGTGSMWIGGNVNANTVTNNNRHLARIVVPTFSDITKGTTLLGFDTSGDSDMSVANKTYDVVSFGGMKKITNATSPMAIGFTVTDTREATAAANKIYALEMDANEARFNVQPNYNGDNLVTSTQLATKQDKIIAGTNIQIAADGKTISATDTKYTAGTGISIDANNVISNTQTSAEWGNITGTLSDQTDLQSALDDKQDELTAGEGISIDANNEISNTLPGAIVSATAPSNPTEGMVWYDTTEDSLKAYNGTSWEAEGTKMVVLSYGHSTWQEFIDAYNKNAIVYCKASSQSNPGSGNQTRMAFMAYVNSATPTEVEFQYYRSRSDHNTAANQLDQVFVYKLTSASGGTWTVTERNTAAKAVAGTGINLAFGSGNMTISADTTTLATKTDLNSKQDTLVSGTNIKTVNSNSLLGSGDIALNDVKVSATAPSSPTEGMVWYDTTNDQLKVYDGTNWNVTGKEYNAGEGIGVGTYNDYSAMQGPAPDGFHIPMQSEWSGLKSIMNGMSLTSSDNRETYLHMPLAGTRSSSHAVIENQGSYAYYWSCSPNSNNSYYLAFDYVGVYIDTYTNRAEAYPIRSFKDYYEIPDSSWTVVQGTLGGAGIFWNQTKGLISITNGTNGYTIMDKNLGATTVYNYGNTLSEANCGKYYQWGNNYGFAWAGTIADQSTTQVDASGYGPGNYYNSSTFIILSDDWSSVPNANLRGGVTGVVTIDNAITNTGVLSVNGQTGNVTVEEPIEYTAGNGISIGNLSISSRQGPCEEGFHVPSAADWQGVETIMNGLGFFDGADWDTKLHLPKAGYRRYSDGEKVVGYSGATGVYWSTSRDSDTYSYKVFILAFDSSNVGTRESECRAIAASIRPFKNAYVAPDATWTVIYGTLGSAGIFWNQTEGLISITDGTNGYTMADKNLGATTVYSSGNTLSEANCGYLYQWGNNYAFPWSGSVTTSSTLVNASSYGPGNYYSSSTFITVSSNPRDWSSVQNNDLWGDTTNTTTNINNAISNTGVLSVNGQIGAVTLNGGDVKVFEVPAVNDDISDMVTRLSAGKGVILHEMVSGTDAFYKVDYHDDVNCEITASLIYSYNGGYARVYTIEYNYSTKKVSTKTPSLTYFFAPETAGTQGQVLTKTNSGYEWANASGGFELAPNSPLTPKYRRYGSQAQYDALTQYYTDNPGDTVYFTI